MGVFKRTMQEIRRSNVGKKNKQYVGGMLNSKTQGFINVL